MKKSLLDLFQATIAALLIGGPFIVYFWRMQVQILARLEKATDRIWGEFCEIYPILIRHNPPIVVLNNRYKRTIASCTPTENKIAMAARYLATNPALMYTEILPHEIAHQIHYILEGEAAWLNQKNHGKQWQKIMLDYGAEPKRAYQI